MSMDLATLQGICEVLRSAQHSDDAIRQGAEKQLDKAWKEAPNELVQQLCAVLAAKDAGGVPVEIRQEAAILLRQSVDPADDRDALWPDLEAATKAGLKTQLLATVQQDESIPVRRNAGNAVTAIVENDVSSCDELVQQWPELLPALSRFVAAGSDSATRIAGLGVLKDLAGTIGDGLVSQGPHIIGMLQSCLSDAVPGVRAAAAQLVLQLIEDLEEEQSASLGEVMPLVIATMQGFVGPPMEEELLRETLESLIAAADVEPDFFRSNGLQQLWPFLLQLCNMQQYADPDVRHSAMEAAMSFAVGFCDDFSKAEGQSLLEQITALNVEWMLEVEEDVDLWTNQADEDDDEIDGDAVQIGEENLDRLADKCAEEKVMEDVFMPALFKVIRAMLQSRGCTWRHIRAAIMAVSQVVEHIEEEAWVDQCVEFLAQHLNHQHPRVRFAVFHAIGQLAYDQEPYIQEHHHGVLLPAIVAALDDTNIRVASNSAAAFVSLGEELAKEDLQPHIDGLMSQFFARLQQGQTRSMQEQCLAGIAMVGEVAEELFVPYYSHVVPVLKQIISKATDEKERLLRGKAFECASLIGDAVGKETFLQDAHEVMQSMMQSLQHGFAPDDPTREYVHEAAGRIAATLERDFKPYVPALLPGIFQVLSQRPQEVDPTNLKDDDDDDDKEDMSLFLVGEKVMGLKTTVLEEMRESLALIITLVEALEDDFVEFLPATCPNLLQLLEIHLSEDVRDKVFKTWETLIDCVRSAVERGKCDQSVLCQLAGEFLKATVTLMAAAPEGADEAALGNLQAQATGCSGVIRKAGKGILSKEDVVGLVKVLVDLLSRVSMKDEVVEMVPRRRRRKDDKEQDADEEDDSDSDEEKPTRQSVRLCLADIAGALMRSNRAEFAEVALPTFMELVQRLLQAGATDGDKTLAFYITDDVVDCLGELSVPYWNIFMEQACHSINDKCPAVRQYACGTIGCGSRQQIFQQIAPACASQLAKLLQRHGERHRRRRAVNPEAKQVALSVDAAIRALGLICENQEQNVGGDCTLAWQMWLNHLPVRYDTDEGQKAHAQLLELVVRNHAVVTAPEQLPRVLAIFADVYKTKFSNSALDHEIAQAVARAGAANVQVFGGTLPDKQLKKVEQMVKDGQAA